MRTFTSVALLLLLAGPARAEEGIIIPPTTLLSIGPSLEAEMPMRWGASKKLVALAIAGQLLDAFSTDYILGTDPNTRKPRGVEANVLMKNVWVRWITKGILVASSGMAEGQQAKIPLLKRVPQWRAEGFVKTTFWTGFIPGTANTIQGLLK